MVIKHTKIVEKEELMTANLKSRILAAKKCQEAGFCLHFISTRSYNMMGGRMNITA